LSAFKDKSKGSLENLEDSKLQDNSILLVWELLEDSYISTYAMKIDSISKIHSEPIEISSHVRLNNHEEILVADNKVFLVSVNGVEKKLELFVFRMR
jgi:hypothetical protein